MTIPTHVHSAFPRDAEVNDYSRSRGSMRQPERERAEQVVDYGNGITAVTYVDHITPHTPEA